MFCDNKNTILIIDVFINSSEVCSKLVEGGGLYSPLALSGARILHIIPNIFVLCVRLFKMTRHCGRMGTRLWFLHQVDFALNVGKEKILDPPQISQNYWSAKINDQGMREGRHCLLFPVWWIKSRSSPLMDASHSMTSHKQVCDDDDVAMQPFPLSVLPFCFYIPLHNSLNHTGILAGSNLTIQTYAMIVPVSFFSGSPHSRFFSRLYGMNAPRVLRKDFMQREQEWLQHARNGRNPRWGSFNK